MGYFNNNDLKGFYKVKGGLRIDNTVFNPEFTTEKDAKMYCNFLSDFYYKVNGNTSNTSGNLEVYTFNLSINKKLYVTVKDNVVNMFCIDKNINFITQNIDKTCLERLMKIESNIVYAVKNKMTIDNVNVKKDYLLANLLLNNNKNNTVVLGYTVDDNLDLIR